MDTRLWTASQLKHSIDLGEFSPSGPCFLSKEVTVSLLSPPNPACREESFPCVTASAEDTPVMQLPLGSPRPVVFSALALNDCKGLQIGMVALPVNGR